MPVTGKTIFVYENWSEETPHLIGKLYAAVHGGQENFSFEYNVEWLKKTNAYPLDPDLAFYQGRQYVPQNKHQFGIFSDSCPDRWGRTLLKRKEAIDARREGRKPRRLNDSDLLLGVYDESRMGALRFSVEEGGPFLSRDQNLATPPWVSLRTLENASLAFEKDEIGQEERWLRQLLAPGSSLGGARPKATVQDVDGSLWIAKFPSKHDEYNTGAWEKVVHDLAKECGLHVPESKLETFSQTGSTFLVKRFDRDGKRRVHFASAMTLLGKTDGVGSEGASYLDLVSFIRSSGASPEEDLSELWNRIVFSMAVSNTDDHLRNHGFLLTPQGWKLSPVYDVNPVPYGEALSLNVNEYDSSIDYELALEVAPYFNIDAATGEKRIHEISFLVNSQWKMLAQRYGFSRSEIERMQPAFSLKP